MSKATNNVYDLIKAAARTITVIIAQLHTVKFLDWMALAWTCDGAKL